MAQKRKRQSYATPESNEPGYKSSSPELVEENDAQTPFTIEYLKSADSKPKTRRGSAKNRAKADHAPGRLETDVAEGQKPVAFTVLPGAHWEGLRKYKNFVVNEEQFGVHDYVFVNHATTKDDGAEDSEHQYWVARVLEVRASGPSCVYLRVFWMYWPTELPKGREYYHGEQELVASNHMEIIDATTVSYKAPVQHLVETDDAPVVTGLYWRQIFDFPTQKTSSLKKGCICRRFHNPDKLLIRCVSPGCNKWMHEPCLLEAAAAKAWERITKSEDPPEPVESPEEEASTPGDTIQLAPKKEEEDISATTTKTPIQTPNSTTSRPLGRTRSKRGGKGKGKTQVQSDRPWEGQLEATLEKKPAKEDESEEGQEPAEVSGRVIFTDLREEEPKTWTEDMDCLFCGKTLVE